MSGIRLTIALESWPLAKPFRITGRVMTHAPTLLVTLGDGAHSGRGEAQGVYYHDETPDSMAVQIEGVRDAIERGIDRAALADLLPPGGALNALDCALWELESHRAGVPVWALAGLARPKPLLTTWTIGADTPELMAADAAALGMARALKLKLIGDGADGARVHAVRAARPNAWIGVDANQALDRAGLEALLPTLSDADVALLEQPVPAGADHLLDGLGAAVPIAADESALTSADLDALPGRYQVVNIKLDKCGGLTAALAMAERARVLGLKVMVGNMVGTSLAMAPAFLVGQVSDVVDLDGPLLLARDRDRAVSYRDGLIHCPDGVWGADERSPA